MKRNKICCTAAAVIAAVVFSSCGSKVEEHTPVLQTVPEIVTTAETISVTTIETTVTTAATTVTETTTEETTTAPVPRVIVSKTNWESNEWDREFMENCLFTGDSVCRALYVYNSLLTTKQVAAVGGGAARNIYDYAFKMEDNEFTLIQAAEHYQPSVIFMWMGMNDINMTTKEEYADNLKKIATDLLAVSPDSKICVLSMTPTSDYHKWQANDRIQEYNLAAEEMCVNAEGMELYYLNIYDIMSDTDGYLLPEYDGGDGMHLSELAYIRMLSYISSVKDVFNGGEVTE